MIFTYYIANFESEILHMWLVGSPSKKNVSQNATVQKGFPLV